MQYIVHENELLPSTYFNGSFADFVSCDLFTMYSTYMETYLKDKSSTSN